MWKFRKFWKIQENSEKPIETQSKNFLGPKISRMHETRNAWTVPGAKFLLGFSLLRKIWLSFFSTIFRRKWKFFFWFSRRIRWFWAFLIFSKKIFKILTKFFFDDFSPKMKNFFFRFLDESGDFEHFWFFRKKIFFKKIKNAQKHLIRRENQKKNFSFWAKNRRKKT